MQNVTHHRSIAILSHIEPSLIWLLAMIFAEEYIVFIKDLVEQVIYDTSEIRNANVCYELDLCG